jgi:hypothetical protein
VSLSPRRIATLGVGFGALSVAYLGLWPVAVEPPTDLPMPPSRTTRGSFALAYEPAIRDVRLHVFARELPDDARLRLVVDQIAPLALVAREPSDAMRVAFNVPRVRASLLLKESSDTATLSATADWSDDDAEIEAILPLLLS